MHNVFNRFFYNLDVLSLLILILRFKLCKYVKKIYDFLLHYCTVCQVIRPSRQLY